MRRRPLRIDKEQVYDLSMLVMGRDELQQAHLRLLLHHPGFRAALAALTEDLEATVGAEEAAAISTYTPEQAPYPVVRFAEEWGLAPGTAAKLASVGLENAERPDVLALDAHAILIWETPSAITVRVPRPITPDRQEAILNFLKQKRKEQGPVEIAWGTAGKKRLEPSPALEEALPWFRRWNSGKEPTTIWRDIQRTSKAGVAREISIDAFVTQLARLWERMRAISPEGIRPDRPSKRKS